MSNRVSESVRAILEITDGRISIHDDDREAGVWVSKTRRCKPLNRTKTHARLVVGTEAGRAEVSLDGEELDALIDRLYKIQQEYASD